MSSEHKERQTLSQCQSCPWRVDCVPDRDIPNGYSRALHQGLRRTIAQPGAVTCSGVAMACHYSSPGEEIPCAGWLHHQIGVGNNIQARLMVMRGAWLPPSVHGQQHQRFEDTLFRSEGTSVLKDAGRGKGLTVVR